MAFNIYMGIFIIFALAVIGGGTMQIKDMGMMAGAFIFFVGSLTIFIIYGIRWFKSGSILAETPVSWPPTINTCPDFLTAYQRDVNGVKKQVCIDTIGVSRNASLPVFPPGGGPAPTDDKYYFDLSTTASDAEGKRQELCQRAILAGLAWEGITNGESCVALPGKGKGGAAGGDGAGCSA